MVPRQLTPAYGTVLPLSDPLQQTFLVILVLARGHDECFQMFLLLVGLLVCFYFDAEGLHAYYTLGAFQHFLPYLLPFDLLLANWQLMIFVVLIEARELCTMAVLSLGFERMTIFVVIGLVPCAS